MYEILQRQTKISNNIVQMMHKRAEAKADVCSIKKQGKTYRIEKTEMKYTGVSNSARALGNSIIEAKLTDKALNNERIKEYYFKSMRLDTNQQRNCPITKTKIVENRVTGRTWGNCAEPHAVYQIVNTIGSDSYISKLKVFNAVTVDDDDVALVHDPIHDARCPNCEQWCGDGGTFLPKNT